MASRQGAAVACRTDIFDISRYAVPSALDGRPPVEILDGCGSGGVGLTGEAREDVSEFLASGKTLAKNHFGRQARLLPIAALYAPV